MTKDTLIAVTKLRREISALRGQIGFVICQGLLDDLDSAEQRGWLADSETANDLLDGIRAYLVGLHGIFIPRL